MHHLRGILLLRNRKLSILIPLEIKCYYKMEVNFIIIALEIFNCDFEFGICTNWKQDKTTDTLDWTLARGATSSQGTGPSTDHTKGTRKPSIFSYVLDPWKVSPWKVIELAANDETSNRRNFNHFLKLRSFSFCFFIFCRKEILFVSTTYLFVEIEKVEEFEIRKDREINTSRRKSGSNSWLMTALSWQNYHRINRSWI